MSTLDDNLKTHQIEYIVQATENMQTTAELMRAESKKFEAETKKLEAERAKLDREDRWMSKAALIVSTIVGIAAVANIAWNIFHH